MKLCTKCHVEQPLDQYGKDRAHKDGHRYSCKSCDAAYRANNREKIAARNKAYREANPEKVAAGQKAYREANPDKIAAQQKAYRDVNLDKIRAQERAYCEANPEKIVALLAKRRAAQLQRTPPWLTRDHNHQMIQIYAERVRLTKETGVQYHVDHIVPLRGKNISGLHVPWNLQVITAHENQTKNNRWSEA